MIELGLIQFANMRVAKRSASYFHFKSVTTHKVLHSVAIIFSLFLCSVWIISFSSFVWLWLCWFSAEERSECGRRRNGAAYGCCCYCCCLRFRHFFSFVERVFSALSSLFSSFIYGSAINYIEFRVHVLSQLSHIEKFSIYTFDDFHLCLLFCQQSTTNRFLFLAPTNDKVKRKCVAKHVKRDKEKQKQQQ